MKPREYFKFYRCFISTWDKAEDKAGFIKAIIEYGLNRRNSQRLTPADTRLFNEEIKPLLEKDWVKVKGGTV